MESSSSNSTSFILLSIILITCINVTLYLTKNLPFITKKKRTLPPGPTGLPIIGDLFTIGDKPHESLSKLSKTYGPLMTVRLGFTTTIVASSIEMAKEILQKHDQSFLGRPIPDAVTAEADNHLSIVWLSGGPLWRNLRKLCNTQIFTTHRLDTLAKLRHRMIEDMVERLVVQATEKVNVNIGTFVSAATLNMLSNTMFSINIMDPKSSGIEELKGLIWKAMELEGKANLSDYFPILKPFDVQGIKKEVKVVYDRLHGVIEGIIKRRLEEREGGEERNGDFLDVLIDNSLESESQYLNLRSMKVLLTHLFIGGTDTTTTTIEWAMAELIRNPDVMIKAKQELSKTIGLGNHIQESHIRQLPYLEAVIKETMRLHPTAPLLLPHCAQTDVELAGYTIPQNTKVFVNAWAIAQNPEYWDEPTKFVPDRFLGTSEFDFRGGRSFTYLPFGSGRRVCPGLDLGVRMLNLLLGSLVHHFDWKLPNEMVPEDIDMSEKFGITLQMVTPLVAVPQVIAAPYCRRHHGGELEKFFKNACFDLFQH